MSQPGARARMACLLITHLPVRAERRRYPFLRRRPLVIVEAVAGGDRVLDASAEAGGVLAGMTLREAMETCGNATVMQADHRFYEDVEEQISLTLERRFGRVESDVPGGMFVDLDRVAAPYGEAHLVSTLLNAVPTGLDPSVGVGPGRFISYALAAAAPVGGTLRAPVDPVAFLRNCPVDLLPLSREKIQRLTFSGLHTLGSLMLVPVSDLQVILGPDAGRAQRLALGIDDVPPAKALRWAA